MTRGVSFKPLLTSAMANVVLRGRRARRVVSIVARGATADAASAAPDAVRESLGLHTSGALLSGAVVRDGLLLPRRMGRAHPDSERDDPGAGVVYRVGSSMRS